VMKHRRLRHCIERRLWGVVLGKSHGVLRTIRDVAKEEISAYQFEDK
jgi:hypothetical protein